MEKDRKILLEYNEVQGHFHDNDIIDGHFHNKPYSCGWEPIALTDVRRSYVFTYIIHARNARRKNRNFPPIKTSEIKRMWIEFCFMYNFILKFYDNTVTEEQKKICKDFDDVAALEKLHHPSFMYSEEGNKENYFEEYNPMSYTESNFYSF